MKVKVLKKASQNTGPRFTHTFTAAPADLGIKRTKVFTMHRTREVKLWERVLLWFVRKQTSVVESDGVRQGIEFKVLRGRYYILREFTSP